MRIHLYAIFVALCLNCAVGEGPTPTPTPRPGIVIQENALLMVMTSADLFVKQIDSKNDPHKLSYEKATATVTGNSSSELSTVVTFGPSTSKDGEVKISQFTINMKYEQADGYWMLSSVSATLMGTETEKGGSRDVSFTDVPLLSEIGLQAYENWSFHCSRFGPLYPAKIPGNHTFSIDLQGFQVQPFTSNTAAFGKHVHECVGFFSIGILMGVFVTLILMAIIAWGLAMIMDVKTMDRFDDPKGKPISLGGAE